MNKTRKHFTHANILSKIHSSFLAKTQKLNKNYNIKTSDCLMAGLAIFALKYPSLLKFEEDRATIDHIKHNLKSLYHVSQAPCDTYLRERLDGFDITIIRSICTELIALMQRGKVLENWKFLDNKFLISLDASGFFSSNKIKCNHCCTKVHNRGTGKERTTYHHQMLVGSVVSPLMKQVLPVNFEPMIKEDGDAKNDCERSCAKRWLNNFRRAYPRLPTVIVADGLYSNGPFIRDLQERNCSYVITAKEDDHKYLYDYFWAGKGEDIGQFESSYAKTVNSKRVDHYNSSYRFMNNVPLNDTNYDLKVNVLHYTEVDLRQSKTTIWCWVTDIEITKDNAEQLMQSGRARWKIENETFNTLKNQGYNFGHGKKGLSNVFAGLMLLAFLIDQCLEAVNLEFKAAITKYKSRSNLFSKIRGKFVEFKITNFDRLYEHMLHGPPGEFVL